MSSYFLFNVFIWIALLTTGDAGLLSRWHQGHGSAFLRRLLPTTTDSTMDTSGTPVGTTEASTTESGASSTAAGTTESGASSTDGSTTGSGASSTAAGTTESGASSTEASTTESGSSSTLRVVPTRGRGASCTKTTPCNIQITGFDARGQGLAFNTINLLANQAWTTWTSNTLFFQEFNPKTPYATPDFVEYFFTGFYDDVLHFAWYESTYNIAAGRIEYPMIRSKVLSIYDLVGLAQQSSVAWMSSNGHWKLVVSQ
eukprot:534175_1